MKTEIKNINITLIDPSGANPRKTFDETSLKRLAETFQAHGIMQPIRVQPTIGDRFEILTGERRYKAARLAQLDFVPCVIVRGVADADAEEQRLIENLAREDLKPMDEAIALSSYKAARPDISDKILAEKLGKSRTRFIQGIKLASLPEEFHTYFRDEDKQGHTLSQSHGEVLFDLFGGAELTEEIKTLVLGLVQKAYKEHWGYRKLKDEVKKAISTPSERGTKDLPARLHNAEGRIMDMFDAASGVEARIKQKGKGKFVIEIEAENTNLAYTISALIGEDYEADDTDYRDEAETDEDETPEAENRILDGSIGRIPTEQETRDFAEAVCDGTASQIAVSDIGANTTGTQRIEYGFNGVYYELMCPIDCDPAALGAGELCKRIMGQDYYGLSMYTRTNDGEPEADPFPGMDDINDIMDSLPGVKVSDPYAPAAPAAPAVPAVPAVPAPTPKPAKKQTATQMIENNIDPKTGERLEIIIPPDLPGVECETVYEAEAV